MSSLSPSSHAALVRFLPVLLRVWLLTLFNLLLQVLNSLLQVIIFLNQNSLFLLKPKRRHLISWKKLFDAVVWILIAPAQLSFANAAAYSDVWAQRPHVVWYLVQIHERLVFAIQRALMHLLQAHHHVRLQLSVLLWPVAFAALKFSLIEKVHNESINISLARDLQAVGASSVVL